MILVQQYQNNSKNIYTEVWISSPQVQIPSLGSSKLIPLFYSPIFPHKSLSRWHSLSVISVSILQHTYKWAFPSKATCQISLSLHERFLPSDPFSFLTFLQQRTTTKETQIPSLHWFWISPPKNCLFDLGLIFRWWVGSIMLGCVWSALSSSSGLLPLRSLRSASPSYDHFLYSLWFLSPLTKMIKEIILHWLWILFLCISASFRMRIRCLLNWPFEKSHLCDMRFQSCFILSSIVTKIDISSSLFILIISSRFVTQVR